MFAHFIHLKRFILTDVRGKAVKDDTPFDIPLRFDMAPFMQGGTAGPRVYVLKGFTSHLDLVKSRTAKPTLDTGHYTATLLGEDGLLRVYNDDQPPSVVSSDVLKGNKSVYLLAYEREVPGPDAAPASGEVVSLDGDVEVADV
jgi:hypothetical protein